MDVQRIADLLDRLVATSLAFVDLDGERFRMLDTIHEYAREKLAASGELEHWRAAHRDWFLAMAELASDALLGSGQSLWLESLEPGKPLSFLDAHIKVGNSLVGVGPGMDLQALVVPDDAFTPVTGDHKPTATLLKKRNKQERDDEALSRMTQEMAAAMTLSSIIGLSIGLVIGVVAGIVLGCFVSLCVAAIPFAIAGGGLGSILGVVLGGGGGAVVAFQKYLDTVNSPFKPQYDKNGPGAPVKPKKKN